MKDKLFFDTNVVIDLLGERAPYYESVVKEKIRKFNMLITRNGKDFKESTIPVLTPDEYLNKYLGQRR